MAANWGRESEGEVSHLGSESESMRRKEAAWQLGGGGCSSCNWRIAARAWVGVGVGVGLGAGVGLGPGLGLAVRVGVRVRVLIVARACSLAVPYG